MPSSNFLSLSLSLSLSLFSHTFTLLHYIPIALFSYCFTFSAVLWDKLSSAYRSLASLVKCSLIFKLKIKYLLAIRGKYIYRSFKRSGIVLQYLYTLLLHQFSFFLIWIYENKWKNSFNYLRHVKRCYRILNKAVFI